MGLDAAENIDIGGYVQFQIVLMTVAAIATFVYLLYSLYMRFNKKGDKKNATNPADDTVVALPSNIFGDLKALMPRLKLRQRNAIRRAYAKKVNGHIKRGVKILAADTTVTIADKIRPQEDIDELTALYEAVRYGERH